MANPVVDRKSIARAYYNTPGTLALSANTNTQLIFTNKFYDIGGFYNTTTGLFTIPPGFAGVYQFWGLFVGNAGLNKTVGYGFWVNGVNNAPDNQGCLIDSGPAATRIFDIHGISILNDGDTAYFNAFCSATMTLNAGCSGGIMRIGNL